MPDKSDDVVWVLEISTNGAPWEPTVPLGLDGREGTLRRKQMERQAELLKSDGYEVKYRVRKYQRVRRGKK